LANPASRAVETFSIDGSGNLQSQGLSPAKQDAAYTQLDPTGELLYVTSADSNLLSIFQVNQNTGALKLAGEPLVVAQKAAPKIVSTGRYVYVQDVGQNPINIYRADAVSGTLQLLGQTSASYQLLAADPSGHFIFAAVQNDFSGEKQNLLMVLQISQNDGSLSEITSSRLRGTNLPTDVVTGSGLNPLGWGVNHIYIGFAGTNGNPDQVVQYAADRNRGVINATGNYYPMGLGEHVSSITVASQVIAEAVDQNGNGVLSSPWSSVNPAPISAPSADRLSASANHQNGYFRGCVQCGNDQWNIASWSLDSNQNATTQYSATTLSGLTTLAADPLDQFLFASIDQGGSVFNKSFSLDRNTGEPSLQNVDWITFDPAYVQAVDPTGKTALSIDPNNGNVAVTYRIEADGNMDWMYVSSFRGTRTIFDPTGRYVIGVNAIGALDPEQGPGQIYVYQVGSDGIEGSLTQVAGPYSTPNTPRDFAMDAAGKFLYVLNGGAVSIFNFDEQTGTMQESPFSPESIAPASAPVATTIAIQNQKN
jgi:6-phosphogluconolactonase (cycloisomerase 2 family)